MTMTCQAVMATAIVCTTVVAPTCQGAPVPNIVDSAVETPVSTIATTEIQPWATTAPHSLVESRQPAEYPITHGPASESSTEAPRGPFSGTTTVLIADPSMTDDVMVRQYRMYEKSGEVVRLQMILGLASVDGIYGPITRAEHVARLGGPKAAVHIFYPELAFSQHSGRETLGELIDRYFEAADRPWARRVAFCESSGQLHHTTTDVVSSALAIGWFQHLAKYWKERSKAAGVDGTSPFDSEPNVAVAAWLFYEGGGARHWNPSRTCWERE